MPKFRFSREEVVKEADGGKLIYASGSAYEMNDSSIARWAMRGAGYPVRDSVKTVLPKRIDQYGNVVYDPAEAEAQALAAEAKAKAAAERAEEDRKAKEEADKAAAAEEEAKKQAAGGTDQKSGRRQK